LRSIRTRQEAGDGDDHGALVDNHGAEFPDRHVRTTDPKVLVLIDAGLSRSATFRRLVDILNESDVIVYVERKRGRQALGGYLAHNIVTRGEYRYLRIAVETQGAQRRLVSLLGHELQHAVEVAQSPDVRDAKSLERMFDRLALEFGCGGTTCSETPGAKDIEHIVSEEFAAPPPRASLVPRPSVERR
jgi:hypothetical protein